jgi:Na+-transporting NADH:ubiquinone oxidoreductase subunit NqrB
MRRGPPAGPAQVRLESERVADPEMPLLAEAEGAWARPVSARRGAILVAAILLATGVFFAWQSALLPFGTVRLPGPGFFPFALGIALGLLALAVLMRAARRDQAKSETLYLGHRDVLVVFVALLGVAFAFERLGAYAALALFTMGLLMLLARAALWRAAAGAGIGTVAVWLVFKVLLGVQLPAGPF